MSAQQKLAAVLFVLDQPKLHILVVEALAKELSASTSLTFDLVGPKGRKSCKFCDADYGIFEDEEGRTFHVNDFKWVGDIHCENIGGFA